MSYNGEIMNMCPTKMFDFSNATAVIVSGAGWNPCGHLLLNTGGIGGFYFHVDELYGYPRYMNEAGFQRYLKQNGKRIIRRNAVHIPNPKAAMLKLEETLAKKWFWGVLPRNCARFVEVVVQGGGANFGYLTNCPTLW